MGQEGWEWRALVVEEHRTNSPARGYSRRAARVRDPPLGPGEAVLEYLIGMLVISSVITDGITLIWPTNMRC